MSPTLILDTNVLVAGLRSSRGASFALMQAVGTGVFEIGVTPALVLEYESVLKRPGKVPLDLADVDDLLNYYCQVGRQALVRFRVRPSARDPDDDLVLEAAVAVGSAWIVTHNTRDMRDGAARLGLELQTPREALQRLGISK